MPTGSFVHGVVWAVTQNFAATAVMIPIVALLCRVFRDRPVVHSLLWSIVLIKFVIPPVPVLAWQVPEIGGGFWTTARDVTTSPTEFSVTTISTDEVAAAADLDLLDDNVLNALPPKQILRPTTTPAELAVISLGVIWIVGAAWLLAGHLIRIRRRYRMVRHGVPAAHRLSDFVNGIARQMGVRKLTTVLVPRIATPFLCCVGRIRLAWPAALSDCEHESIRSIVAHEVAHLRRRDHWIAWLEFVGSMIWWWNPLFWIARSQWRCSTEMACDAAALAVYPDDRCTYAETLLWLSTMSETGAPPLTLAVNGGTPSSLERRMRMIVSARASDKLPIVGMAAAALMTLALMSGLSTAQSTEENSPPSIKRSDDTVGQPTQKQALEQYLRTLAQSQTTTTGDVDPATAAPADAATQKLAAERAALQAQIARLQEQLQLLSDQNAQSPDQKRAGMKPGESPSKLPKPNSASVPAGDLQDVIIRSEDGKQIVVIVERNGSMTRLLGERIVLRDGKIVEVHGNGSLRMGIAPEDDARNVSTKPKGGMKGPGVDAEGYYKVLTKGDDGTVFVEKWQKLEGQDPRLIERTQMAQEQLELLHRKEALKSSQDADAKRASNQVYGWVDGDAKAAPQAKPGEQAGDAVKKPIAPGDAYQQQHKEALVRKLESANQGLRDKLQAQAKEQGRVNATDSVSSAKPVAAHQIDLISLATAYADALANVEGTKDVEAKERAARKLNLLRRIAQVELTSVTQDFQRLEQLVKSGVASPREATELQARRDILKEILATGADSAETKSNGRGSEPQTR